MNFRTKLGIVILAGALMVAGILLFSSPDKTAAPKNSVDKNSAGKAEPFQLGKSGQKLGVINLEDLSGLLTNQTKRENLTQQLADSLAQGFIKENPGDVDLEKGLKTPKEEFIWNQTAQSQPDFFKEYFQLADLKISSVDSSNSQKDYLNQLSKILTDYQSKVLLKSLNNLKNFTETQDPGYLKPLISEYYDPLLREVKNLSVPKSLANFHKDFLNLIMAEREIFYALGDYQNDPLKAILASQVLNLVQEKEMNFILELSQKLKNLGL